MKANIALSYRIKMMLYTLLSLVITLTMDVLVIYMYRNINYSIRTGTNLSAIPHVPETEGMLRDNGAMQYNNMTRGGGSMQNSVDFRLSWQFCMILMIISIALFLVLFQLFTRNIALYLQEITQGIQKISEGNFETRIPVKYNDEFSMIANNINCMAMDLEFLKKSEQKEETKKNDLITNVAHDLRTPLTSIIGYLDILNTHPEFSEEQKKKYIQIVYNKSTKLQTLIEDLFSFTKLTYGKMPMRFTKLNLVMLVSQEVEEFYPDLLENHMTCDFKCDADEVNVMADGALLARAFGNLISNAIKYGRDGKKVNVSLEIQNEFAKVCIINYGSVIPKEDLPFVFDKFYRVEQSRQQNLGGTGLGLSITKAIIESHKGDIKAKSSLEGTVFEVRLPVCET